VNSAFTSVYLRILRVFLHFMGGSVTPLADAHGVFWQFMCFCARFCVFQGETPSPGDTGTNLKSCGVTLAWPLINEDYLFKLFIIFGNIRVCQLVLLTCFACCHVTRQC